MTSSTKGKYSVRIGWLTILFCGATLAMPPPASPRFETLGVMDGLPSSTVYKLAQDNEGFIWIATHDGLARYDGVNFRVWRHDVADPASLAANDVAALFVDRDGQVWCGGEASGLNVLDPKSGKFQHYRHRANDIHSIGSDDVWAITQDAKGTIWVGTYAGGLNRLNADGTFTRFTHDDARADSLRSDIVGSLLSDVQGRLWIGTNLGLDVLDANQHLTHIAIPELDKQAGPSRINALQPDGAGGVYLGTRKGIVHVDVDLKPRVLTVVQPSPNVFGLAYEESGVLWAATADGILYIDKNNKYYHYTANEGLPGALPGKYVLDILRDREGGLWFGLFEGGLARLPSHGRAFNTYPHIPGDAASLTHAAITGVSVADDGVIWAVSGDNGVDRIDPNDGHIERYAQRLSVQGNKLWSVLAMDATYLWIGHTHGVSVYNLDSSQHVDLPVADHRDDALPSGVVNPLLRAPDGKVWAVARGGGLARIDPATLAIHRYTPAARTLDDADISALAFDAQGRPWVATATGLERYDPIHDSFHRETGIARELIDAMAFMQDGSLWLHTSNALKHYRVGGAGLTLLAQVDADKGWPTLAVNALTVARDGNVWATSSRGLWRIDGHSHELRQFNNRDGLPSVEFSRNAMAIVPDGTIYAGTMRGMLAFDPSTVLLETSPAPLRLTQLTLRRGGDIVTLDPAAGTPLSLYHGDRDFTVQARELSFINSQSNRYLFWLEGFDHDWVVADHGERVFSQLNPGHYRLRVRAANAVGVWSELQSPLDFKVAPALWATPWAYAVYTFMMLCLGMLMLRGYRHRLERRHRLALAEQQRHAAEQINEAKSIFFAMLSHEIRTPMTGVLGMTELLQGTVLDERQRGYTEAVRQSGELLLRVVNDSLDIARIEAGKFELEMKPLNLAELIKQTIALSLPLAGRKGLLLQVSIAPGTSLYVLGDALRLKQILLNLVNNALKFTETGSVTVMLERDTDGIYRLHITDTGPGMSDDVCSRLFRRFEQANSGIVQRYGGSGLGLSICQELVELMGGHIEVRSVLQEGSVFTVVLPLLKSIVETSLVTTLVGEQNTETTNRILHVLLVEDDTTAAQVISGLLDMMGHQVTHVVQGLAALAELASKPIDIALIDLDLPGIDGLQLARLIRARETTARQRLPIIAITARSMGDEEAQIRAAGMDELLRKPLTGAMLKTIIDRVVGM